MKLRDEFHRLCLVRVKLNMKTLRLLSLSIMNNNKKNVYGNGSLDPQSGKPQLDLFHIIGYNRFVTDLDC